MDLVKETTKAGFGRMPPALLMYHGAVVNKLSKRFMMSESAVAFELNRCVGVKLRVTQTRDIVQFITHQGLNLRTF